MNESNIDYLNAEIGSELVALDDLECGSQEHERAICDVTKLMDRAIELRKLDLERERIIEQVENEKKESRIRNWLAAAGLIIPTGVTIWGTLKTLKFEETGTVTTMMGRNFISKLLPKK